MHSSIDRGLTIAIDGFSSCGKSTFAKAIASKLGYIFIDTGAMYRAVTLAALRAEVISPNKEVNKARLEALLPTLNIGFHFNKERGTSEIYLNEESIEESIRTMEVSGVVSAVSAVEAVREKLVALQQDMGRAGGVVMDGRDIGTVVFPAAEIKIYMVADPKVRAMRRFRELQAKGDMTPLEQVEQNVEQRDNADLTRSISPLRRADDALLLDNSNMSHEDQMVWFDELYSRVMEGRA